MINFHLKTGKNICSYRSLFPSIYNGLIHNAVFKKKKLEQGGGMAQWVEVPMAMPDNLSLIL